MENDIEWQNTYLNLTWMVANPKKFAKYLKSWNLDKNSVILDLCCGNGGCFQVFNDADYKKVFGLDISSNLLSNVKTNVPLMQGDVFQCPVKDNAVDVVFINKALHHFLDFAPLLSEIKRVLKPNGVFCFVEPRSTWFRNLYHAVFLSPFADIWAPLKRFKYACLIAEADTYFPWLKNAHTFFKMLEEKFDFTIESNNKNLAHYVVKCKNGKTLENLSTH